MIRRNHRSINGRSSQNTAVFLYNAYVTETLLQTKLYIPILRSPNLVDRLRLIEQLNQGLVTGNKLILVSAPAGFGKSTLLSAWALQAELQPRVAWLSLDAGDNDLTRFLTYFVAALQTIKSDIGRGVLVALQSPGKPNIEGVLAALLNELAMFPHDAALILDDYHVIESQPVDASTSVDGAINFLLDHLPSQMHLTIATRTDPTLTLSRLRASGLMIELREADLRFTKAETADFLNRMMGFDLPAQDVAALGTRTEGWIAGLQLAALSMQGSDDVQKFVRSFTGSTRYIHDYLTDEVLLRQPPDVRDFLLQTSILNHLCGSLCDAVRFGASQGTGSSPSGLRDVGWATGQETLEALDTANLFIVPLDEQRHWYRYHHLFADLLRHRLMRTYPELIPDLHLRASVWYESEGHTAEAFRHALDAGDISRAAELLEERWQFFVHRGELTELQRMLDTLGHEVTKNSAPLSIAYCWLCTLLTGDHESIPTHLEDVRQALKVGSETGANHSALKYAVIPSLVETMEATVNYERGDPGAAKEHAQKALSLIPGEATPAARGLLQASAGFWLAQAHKDLGEIDQACAVYLKNIELMKTSQNQMGAAGSVLEIASLYRQSGRTRETIALCEDMLTFISQQGWETLPPSGIVHLVLAKAQADVGDFEGAKKNAKIGRELVEPIKNYRYSDLLEELLTAVEAKIAGVAFPYQPLVEPLSPRELEVLQLIAQGLSNRQIGERLFLALSTVKGHNRNIFDKLQVQRRTEAVARARELDLV